MFKAIASFCFITIFIVCSCKTTAPPPKVVTETAPLLEIGNHKFSLEEYQEAYNKNKFATDSTKELSPQEYLALYTDLKIKVLQAKQDGKDTTLDYREEINSYREQLAKNHLVDKALVEKLTNEVYNRLKQEVRASHILIGVSEDASPADTLEAYRAAIALRGRLEEGSDFGDMAARFSKDPAAKKTKGDLGYFTAFQTLYPIESAAYALAVGRVSQPVRTKAGYHLIKVMDRRTNRGMVQIAHLMVKLDSTSTAAQKQSAKERIDEAYGHLQAGEDWAEVVESYSDDKQSSKNKGLLPMFGIGQMVQEIEDASFNLKVNTYSKPILTIYGWHIIKLIEKRSIEPFAVMAPALRKKVVTDSRAKIIEQSSISRLREKYVVQEFDDQWKAVSALADSTLRTGKWDYMKAVTADWSDVTLFKIEDKPFDALSFLTYVKRKQLPKSKEASPALLFRRYYNEYVAERLSDYEREHLEETNTEFRILMNEIRDGVLLSQMMEENVWQRSLSDSTGQVGFYNRNKQRYNFPERALGMVISAKDTQTVNAIRKAFATSPYKLERKSKEILFAANASEIGKEQQDAIHDLYIIMRKNPEYIVETAGYRSDDESEITSATRIRNAVKYLTAQNIPILRIIEKDYGSFRPAADPERNRRVGFQFYSPSGKDLEKAFSEDNENPVSIQDGYFTKESAVFVKLKWQAGEQTTSDNNAVIWANITKIEAPRAKTFTEARGAVINDYQKELEKQWLARLTQKFPVKVNAEELEKIKR
ncbi:peptidylprolyl isomerase [Dyadobacter arcticus]|uniref:Peptidyl-prolyl cis-trans isomerase SurA n=1 Tax=Dyadobacter arcticus TaxID=1078754 RepID=A0ABX0UKX3_9BACT|nr:peptidylprolyl isomerase [Dyadobacter arcticus]NIJ53113.1 peptidyl-prolyl cis-trans isomerase SurA [Dyadobacter arcticus]